MAVWLQDFNASCRGSWKNREKCNARTEIKLLCNLGGGLDYTWEVEDSTESA